MNLGVNREGRGVDRPVALDNHPLVVHQQEVGHPDVPEVHTERIHPKMVEAFGIPGGDVAGHAFVKTEFGEQPKPGGQSLLAVEAFLLDRVEHQ